MMRLTFLAAVAFVSACSTTEEPGNGTTSAGGSDAATGATGGNAGTAAGGSAGRSSGGAPGGGSGGASGSTAGGAPGAGAANGGAGGSSGNAGAGGASGGTGGSTNTGGAPGTGGAPSATTAFVYVGSGDFNGGNGAATLYRFDYQTAMLSSADRIFVGGLAAFMAIDSANSRLFIADEQEGNLRRVPLDGITHVMDRTMVQTQATPGGHPVHVTTTRDGRFALVAHYNEGKAESFGVQNDTLGASLDVESPGSQAHAAVLAPDEKFAFVPCKGSDRIARFGFDAATGALSALAPVNTQSGDGPRHMAFHPIGNYAYVVNELSSSVIAYSYAAATGTLTELMRTTTLPSGFSGTSTGAEIAVDPSGRFLYASNRFTGANGDIVAFAINAADGRISLIGHQSTGGRTPRSFSIDPTGRFLFVGNQGSNTVGVLAIDGATGTLGAAKTTDVGVTPYFVGAAPFTE